MFLYMHRMALNFSQRPIFQAHLSEDNLVAPMRIGNGYLMESISEKSGDGFGTTWHDFENFFDYGWDICDKTSSEESASKDILDLLPSDPFGMDMDISTTFTAITGWLEDLEIDYGKYTSDEAGESDGNYQLFAGLNFIWNNAILFHVFPGNTCIENKLHVLSGFGECSQKEVEVSLSNDGFGSACDMGECSQKDVGVALSNDGFGSAYDMGECSQKEVGVALSNDGFGSACDMGECPQKEVGVGLSNDGFGSACDMGECSQKEVGVALSNDGFGSACDMGECSQKEVGVALSNDDFESACDMGDILGLSYKDEGIGGRSGDPCMNIRSPLEDRLASHSDLSVVFGYLSVRDLLVFETASKSLLSTVRDDPFLWTKIHVEQPLNEKLTDDLLVKLTNRAQGHLQCLSLVECTRITDDGLKRVLESNPKLTKLSVPGCTRLSIEGIVSILKAFKSTGTQGVKHLRIGGLYGVTHKHFEELKLLLGTNGQMPQHNHKLHFYRRGNLYLSYDDDRAIDIEMCSRCQNLRLVYDCPADSCQGTGHTTQVCRACTLCIARCSQCGQCINDNEYEETFCLELLCSCCSRLVKCRDGDAFQGAV